jgi:hypothetical protein
LVSLLTGLGSIVGSILIGVLTDGLPFSRRGRALSGVAFVAVLNCIIWGCGIGFQSQFTHANTSVRGHSIPLDWNVGVSIGPVLLIFACEMISLSYLLRISANSRLLLSDCIADAAYQGLAYYTMSTLCNDPFKLARMAGYYKGVQSAGAAVSYGMDAVKTSYLGEILIPWLMLLLSLPLCALVLWYTRETNYDVEETVDIEDIKNDAIGDVAVPKGHEIGEHIHATEPTTEEKTV